MFVWPLPVAATAERAATPVTRRPPAGARLCQRQRRRAGGRLRRQRCAPPTPRCALDAGDTRKGVVRRAQPPRPGHSAGGVDVDEEQERRAARLLERVRHAAQDAVSPPLCVHSVAPVGAPVAAAGSSSRGGTLRVVLGGGAALHDCERVARALLERELGLHERGNDGGGAGGEWSLEVTTPGASNVLVRDREFAAFKGFAVTVALREPHQKLGTRVRGTLAGRDAQHVRVNVKGRAVRLPRNVVAEVRLDEPLPEEEGGKEEAETEEKDDDDESNSDGGV